MTAQEQITPYDPTPPADEPFEAGAAATAESAPSELTCDIIMKGGVTSGIVYPGAIAEISKTFRFVNIGGTSAGAIAATLTAAAEYRRRTTGSDSGFATIDGIPAELGKNKKLMGLFAPNAVARPYFKLLTTLAGRGGFGAKILDLALLALTDFPIVTISGAVGGAVVAWALAGSVTTLTPVQWTVSGLLVLFDASIAFAVSVAVGFVVKFKQNGYGLCSGIVDGDDGSDTSALSAWLSDKIDSVAGMAKRRPLTFGDLWYARLSDGTEAGERPEFPAINLEAVTTSINHGRPYTFPTGSHIFMFVAKELRPFLPGYVVDWMKEHSRDAHLYPSVDKIPEDTIIQMPLDRDLPIVFAARLSLSFPVLLRPVKLYARDYSHADTTSDPSDPSDPSDCWFTDGGLSSNFPIHSFDAPLPSRPTFGLNLGLFTDSHPYTKGDQRRNFFMPPDNKPTTEGLWTRFDSPLTYFSSMLDAIREWNDKTLMQMPGYRDRIATVMLQPSEGGLNLDMPPDVITELALRGKAAGAELVRRFSIPSVGNFKQGMTWENHRVVRYRAVMDMLQRWLGAFGSRFHAPGEPEDVAYKDLVRAGAVANGRMVPYAWPATGNTRAASFVETEKIADIAAEWKRAGVDFGLGAPHPRGELGVRVIY